MNKEKNTNDKQTNKQRNEKQLEELKVALLPNKGELFVGGYDEGDILPFEA
jgi:hypothetical protein